MIALYFGNFIILLSSLAVFGIWIYAFFAISKHKNIENWGRRVFILVVWGLLLCILVAIRDNYHLSVQSSMDSTISPGTFTIDSIQSTLCCVGGALIAFCSISSLFIRKQKYWKIMFFVLTATIVVKTLIIEVSRILLL